MKSRKLKFLGWALVLIVGLFIIARVYYAVTDDFRLSNISYPLPKEESWDIPNLTAEEQQQVDKILSQPFHYLGKGAQSYAFASDDGLYVLKFFKFKHLRPSFFIDMIPPIGPLKAYKEQQAARKDRKLFGVFNAYRLAYELDRAESGLIFIQLNTQDNPRRTVTLIDKIGMTRHAELQHVPFILQKKGVTLRNVLSGLLNDGDVSKAKERISQIFDMYAEEYKKGIYDHDHGVMQNTGFVGNQPIHLDVGKLVKEPKIRERKFAKNDAQLVADKIKAWIELNFPKYSKELSAYIDEKVETLFNE